MPATKTSARNPSRRRPWPSDACGRTGGQYLSCLSAGLTRTPKPSSHLQIVDPFESNARHDGVDDASSTRARAAPWTNRQSGDPPTTTITVFCQSRDRRKASNSLASCPIDGPKTIPIAPADLGDPFRRHWRLPRIERPARAPTTRSPRHSSSSRNPDTTGIPGWKPNVKSV
jgi:hypothetical protein